MEATGANDVSRLPNFEGDIVGLVMALAAATAIQLAHKGILASAVVEDGIEEAVCLKITIHGDPSPFYIQPMAQELSVDEEQYIELYVERDDADWEPFPFQVCIEDGDGVLEDVDRMFRTISTWTSNT